jgi:DNA-binding XRE family transcriptional regulator
MNIDDGDDPKFREYGSNWKCGLNPKYLGQIERGEKRPSFDAIMALAKALGVEPEVLFRFNSDETDEKGMRKNTRDNMKGCAVCSRSKPMLPWHTSASTTVSPSTGCATSVTSLTGGLVLSRLQPSTAIRSIPCANPSLSTSNNWDRSIPNLVSSILAEY